MKKLAKNKVIREDVFADNLKQI
jgi:hypothetical protein